MAGKVPTGLHSHRWRFRFDKLEEVVGSKPRTKTRLSEANKLRAKLKLFGDISMVSPLHEFSFAHCRVKSTCDPKQKWKGGKFSSSQVWHLLLNKWKLKLDALHRAYVSIQQDVIVAKSCNKFKFRGPSSRADARDASRWEHFGRRTDIWNPCT